MKPVLYVIVPCYNEEKVLPYTSQLFLEQLVKMINLDKISDHSKIMFVNDGSADNTWEIINNLAQSDEHYIGISLSRNRGHQNAVLGGLMEAKDNCDITISIDCDGQDDIGAMSDMVDAYYEGAEVVYGVRSKRDKDTFFKRFTAESFYKLLKWMGVETVYNHADYRLISSNVLQEFAEYKEVNLFLRGMIPLVGFNSTYVYYERHERIAGESHYPLKKMLELAMDGITSLSTKPLHIITSCGMVVSGISLIGVVSVIVKFFLTHSVAELVLMTSVICLVCGINTVCLGVVGEYIGKIYLETKGRPRYIISKRTSEKNGHV